jgi:hypothetical protein
MAKKVPRWLLILELAPVLTELIRDIVLRWKDVDDDKSISSSQSFIPPPIGETERGVCRDE